MPIPWWWLSFYPVSWGPTPPSVTTYDFSINWISIQDCTGEFIQELNYNDINKIDFDSYSSPLTNGWGVVGYFVNWKDLDLKMVLLWQSEADLNIKISNLKRNLYGREKILQVVVDWIPRVATVNLTNLQFNQSQADKKLLANIEAKFTSMDWFQQISPQSVSFLGIVSDWTEDILNFGEYESNAKVIMVFNTWILALNEVEIEVNGYICTVNQAISDWDVLIFDWIEKNCTLNWTQIPYIWPIDLQLEVWSNLMNFRFEAGSTVNLDITVIYPYKYL